MDIQVIETWTSRMRSVRATTVPNAHIDWSFEAVPDGATLHVDPRLNVLVQVQVVTVHLSPKCVRQPTQENRAGYE